MDVSLIAAMTPGTHVIGKDNSIPWKVPSDLKRFKELTTGKPVIMGRKTYESIIEFLGKPLPNRINIVISSQRVFEAPGCVVANSVTKSVKLCEEMGYDRVFVIGGAEIYKQAIHIANEMLISFILGPYDGDTIFPPFGPEWSLVKTELATKGPKDDAPHSFCVYKRNIIKS